MVYMFMYTGLHEGVVWYLITLQVWLAYFACVIFFNLSCTPVNTLIALHLTCNGTVITRRSLWLYSLTQIPHLTLQWEFPFWRKPGYLISEMWFCLYSALTTCMNWLSLHTIKLVLFGLGCPTRVVSMLELCIWSGLPVPVLWHLVLISLISLGWMQ